MPAFLDYAQEAKALLIAALLAGLALRAAARGEAALPALGNGMTRAMLGMALVLAALGARWAPDAGAALLALRNEGLALAAAVAIAAFSQRDEALKALFFGATAVALLGVLQVFFDVHWLTPAADAGQFPAVSFGNRGLASLFVALGVLPGVRLAQQRQWLWIGVALQVVFVGLAMTRAVWIGGAAAALSFMLASKRPRRLGLTLGALAVAVAVALAFVRANDSLSLLLSQRLDPSSYLHNPRLTLWHAALSGYLAEGPRAWFFGFGPGAFQVLAPKWLEGSELSARMFLDAHNDPLQYLLEYGLVGLGLRAAVIASLLRRAAPVHRANAVLLLGASFFFYPLHLSFFMTLFAYFLTADAERRTMQAPGRVAAFFVAVAAISICLQRVPLELAMRRYVRTPEPSFVKAAERMALEDRLRHAPAPYLYGQMLARPPGEPPPRTPLRQ